MSTYLLVHGAAHGSWCWYKVVAQLREAGHEVVALDLPGHGIDRTPPGQVTLQTYVQCVCQELEQQNEPVTLVGHSMAGAIISQVAEVLPQKIRTLVYLATPLLRSGESLMQVATEAMRSDEEHVRVIDAMITDPSGSTYHFARDDVEELFYHDCEAADIALAKALLTPQAMAPLVTPVRLSERYESVRRVSIETTLDRAVSINLQRHQRAHKLCNQVKTLESSHSPFFSMPEQLVQCLVTV